MNCPRCQHPHFVKNGRIHEKQRYKCKDCHSQWTENHTYRGRPVAEKALAVFLYCHGLSMNVIAKMLHASPSTILAWIRTFGGEHAKPPEPQETGAVVLELDEMWHYLKKKQTLSVGREVAGLTARNLSPDRGYGKLCVVIPENASHGSGVIEIKRPSKDSWDV